MTVDVRQELSKLYEEMSTVECKLHPTILKAEVTDVTKLNNVLLKVAIAKDAIKEILIGD